MTDFKPLEKEDYAEPRCPFCTDFHEKEEKPLENIPTSRIIEKLDRDYLFLNDYVGAERHLKYWLGESIDAKDYRAELTIRNELIGLYRKTGKKEQALENCHKSLELVNKLGMESSATAGTTYINVATAYKAFSMAKEGIVYYETALKVYEENIDRNDERFGGLYNNMGLALTDLHEYQKAREYYNKAIDVMIQIPGKEGEVAITYLNIADLVVREQGEEASDEEIDSLCEGAMKFLNSPNILRDGNYAFICEKCAPVFGGFGYFKYENEIAKRAEEIYAGN